MVFSCLVSRPTTTRSIRGGHTTWLRVGPISRSRPIHVCACITNPREKRELVCCSPGFTPLIYRVTTWRAEEKSAGSRHPGQKPSLSERMRNSCKTGRFWINCAARTCFDTDHICWHTLHDELGSNQQAFIDEVLVSVAQRDPLIQNKMEQRNAHFEECGVRFSDGGWNT